MRATRFIFLLVAIAPFLVSPASALFGEYDNDCKTNTDCLSESFLYCNQYQKCACAVIPGVELFHDPIAKKCLIPIGTSCHLQSESGEPTCTSGSSCTKTEWSNDPLKGLCTCDRGYQRYEKICVAKIPIDGTCEIPSSPNSVIHECIEFAECDRYTNKCYCKDGLVYDRQNKECTLKTGASCHIVPEVGKEPVCSSNAICEKQPWIVDPSKGLCTCKLEFPNHPHENRCLKKNVPIGEYCEVDQPATVHSCNGFSTCQNERCDCAVKGADVVEDPDTNTCALAVGSSCDKIFDPLVEVTCPSNSECLTSTWNPTKGICGCSAKFEINPQARTCLRRLDVGVSCEVKDPSRFVRSCIEYGECDETSKQCNCWSTFETVNNDNSTCNLKGTGLADEPCLLDAPICTDNAECQKLTNPLAPIEEDVVGVCECGLAHTASFDKLCLWTPNQYDEPCQANIECNHRKSMTCNGEKCACLRPTTMVYNESDRACLTLVGTTGICDLVPGEDGIYPAKCVANAECKPKTNDSTVGNCVCTDQFAPTSENFCEAIKGEDNSGVGIVGPLILLLGVLQALVFMI